MNGFERYTKKTRRQVLLEEWNELSFRHGNSREGAPLGRNRYVELQIKKARTNGERAKLSPFQKSCESMTEAVNHRTLCMLPPVELFWPYCHIYDMIIHI
jgi:hypothetical protein